MKAPAVVKGKEVNTKAPKPPALKTVELLPMAAMALDNAMNVADRMKADAEEMLKASKAYRVKATQDVLDAMGIDGQVDGVEFKSPGKSKSIQYYPRDPE